MQGIGIHNLNFYKQTTINTFSLIEKASRLLLDLCLRRECWKGNIFEAKQIPKISIEQYLDRIIELSEAENSTLIIGIILISVGITGKKSKK